MKKRVLSLLLCLVMALSLLPTAAFAADGDTTHITNSNADYDNYVTDLYLTRQDNGKYTVKLECSNLNNISGHPGDDIDGMIVWMITDGDGSDITGLSYWRYEEVSLPLPTYWSTTETDVALEADHTYQLYCIGVDDGGNDVWEPAPMEFKVPALAPITTGNVTVTAPVAGQTPDFTAVTDQPGKYSAEVYAWVDMAANMDITPAMVSNSLSTYYNYKFEGGKEYKAIVKLTGVNGYTVDYGNSVTINGNTTGWQINGLYRTCKFTATGTGGGSETPVYAASVDDLYITLPANYDSNTIDELGASKCIRVTNTGNRTLNVSSSSVTLTGDTTGKLLLAMNSVPAVIPVDHTNTDWFISPEPGLAPGTYTATISFRDNSSQLSAPVTATLTVVVGDHHFDTSVWKSDSTTHWHPCTDDRCMERGYESAHNSDTVKNAAAATFDTDGYSGDKYCSVCDRAMESGKVVAAGKYIRQSAATMAPTTITSDNCANDLVFTSADPSKYTVARSRVIDLTDNSLNTSSGTYPSDKRFIEGHKYSIDFRFTAVAPYVYKEDSSDYWSTFKLNGAAADISNAAVMSGAVLRKIELVAGKGSEVTKTINAFAADPVWGTVTGGGTYKVGDTVTLTATAAAGYTFDCWVDQWGCVITGAGAEYSFTLEEGSSEKYAAWFEEVPVGNYTVSFDMNGHGTAPATQTIPEGNQATEPTVPTAIGYIFGGWYTNASCTTPFDFSTPITANTTVYAKWTDNRTTINSINITVDTPIVGKSAAESVFVPTFTTDPADAVYVNMAWTDWYNNSCIGEFTGIFQANTEYIYEICLMAKDGYRFPSVACDDMALANGAAVKYVDVCSNGEYAYIGIVMTPTCTHAGTVVTDKAVAATYAKTGKTEGKHCSACGKVLTAQKTVAMKKLAQAKITSITNTSTGITVKWGKVTGATAYQVYRRVGSGEWKLWKTTTSTSVSNSGLTNGTRYQYKVRAVVKNSAGKVVNTGAFSAIKTMYRLTRPTLASGTKNIATRKIVVKWNKNTKVTGYQVKYVKGTTTKTVTVKGASTLSKTLSSLTKGATYKVYVRSYKTVSGTNYYSAWSAYKSVKVAK